MRIALLFVFVFGGFMFSLYATLPLDSLEAYKVGMDFYKKRSYDSAAIHFEIASHTCSQSNLWADHARSVTYLGRSLTRTGNLENALEHYKKAIDRFEENDFTDENVARIYGYSGNILMRQLSYEKALPFHEKAVEISRSTGDSQGIVLRCADLVTCLNFLEKYDTSIQTYLQVKDLFPEEGFYQALLYLSITEAYFILEDFDQAYDLTQRVAKITLDIQKDPKHPRKRFIPYLLASVTSTNAKIYEHQKKWKDALYYHRLALEYSIEYFGPTNREIARRYTNLGQFFQKNTPYQNPQDALEAYQNVLIQVIPGFNDTSLSAYPAIENFYPEPFIMTGLIGKAETFASMYKPGDSSTVRYLHRSREAFELGFASIRHLRNEYSEDVSKEYLSGYTYPMYEKAIGVCWDLYNETKESRYLEKAFALSDASKSVTLWQTLQHKKAKTGNIPDSLLEKEIFLKKGLTHTKQQLRNAISSKNTESTSLYRDSTLYFQRKLEILVQRLESDFAAYHQLKYAETPVDTKSIRSQLAGNTTLAEYFWGDHDLLIFMLNSDTFQVIRKPMPEDASVWINTYHRALTDFTLIEDLAEKADQIYLEQAFNLYNFLLKDVVDNLNNKSEHLLIVPDGPLGYIPFGTLLKSKTETLSRSAPWVFVDHPIRYEYASRFLLKKQERSTEFQAAYAAFSPDYKGSPLPDLPISRTATKSLAKMLGGKRWTGIEATREAFFRHAPHYQVLHLAMHAQADDDEPLDSHFVFSSGEKGGVDSLMLENLYTMDLSADLVVLSACETGAGYLKRGEGIISLARGFAYAQCPSLLVSLWSLQDGPTAEISASFLENIQAKAPKDISLQSARLSFLEKGGQPHPYYWAGLVLAGNNEPVVMVSSKSWVWWVLGLGLILIIGIGWWWKKSI